MCWCDLHLPATTSVHPPPRETPSQGTDCTAPALCTWCGDKSCTSQTLLPIGAQETARCKSIHEQIKLKTQYDTLGERRNARRRRGAAKQQINMNGAWMESISAVYVLCATVGRAAIMTLLLLLLLLYIVGGKRIAEQREKCGVLTSLISLW